MEGWPWWEDAVVRHQCAPLPMEIAIVLSLLVVAILLFALEIVSVDIVTLLLLVALVSFGVLSPGEAFSGFSNEIIIILGSIFVLSGALRETGLLDAGGAYLLKIASRSRYRLLFVLTSAVASISAFMNNTTVTAMFLGPVMNVARKAKVSPSKLLMPLAHASILGGTCTVIGTSTNMAVSGFLSQEGMPAIGLFEITPVGVVMVAIGVLYMIFVGNHLLPERRGVSLTEGYQIREYLTEIVVMPNSPLIGQEPFDSDLSILNFSILKILRADESLLPESVDRIHEGDILLVRGQVENLIKVKKIEGIEIDPELRVSDKDLRTRKIRIAEVLISPQSNVIGRTFRGIKFRQRYGLTVLAVYRAGHSLWDKIGKVRLRAGDMLLVQGAADRLEGLKESLDLEVLGEVSPHEVRQKRGIATVSIFLGAILLATLGLAPLSISLLGAALAAILLRSITVEQAYQAVEWRVLILIGGMTAFGLAMDKSGTAEFLGHWIVLGLGALGITAVLAGFLLLTVLLTQVMSNAAAALVVLPIALSAAGQLGVSPRSFAIAVMLAASISLVTPLEPACLIVYGPGKYKFKDFVIAGAGLTVLLMMVILYMVPRIWQF